MTRIVDLRSDTITKPSASMKHAMVNSALGNATYGEDPTVNALESKIAAMLGKQAAIFVPSGTMANLIAVMVHFNKRGSEAIVGNLSHIYKYEQGGASHLGGVMIGTIQNKPDGTFDLKQLEKQIRGSDIHEPVTSLVCVENTHNVCGGKALPLQWLGQLSALCKKHSLPLHMDGARLFNACEYLRESPERVVQECTSVSVCFSKGLSAPVGSALVGDCHFIEQARRICQMLGGTMHQSGVLAAAAIVALDEIVPNLGVDHKRALILAKAVNLSKNFTIDIENQHSNIVLLKIAPSSGVTAEKLVQRLQQVSLTETQGDCKTDAGEGVIVKCIYFNETTVRFTLHCNITDEELWLAIMKITFVLKEFESK